jgi:hypothetical protein
MVATPDVLDAPDNKVNPRPRCRTSVANESNPRALRSQMQYSARTYVCARAFVGATRVAT